MNHTLIINYIIKENVPSGRNRYDSWLHKEKGLGLSERVGRRRNKGRSDVSIVNTVSYAFKITAYLEKENAINIYSELLVVDERPCPLKNVSAGKLDMLW